MNRGMVKFHLFYAVAPVLAYYVITILVVLVCGLLSVDNNILNSINIAVNLILLYVMFYRPYQRIQVRDRMPALLPKGKMTAAGAIPVWTYGLIVLAGVSASIALNNWFVIFKLPEKITTYKEVAQSIYSGNVIILFLRAVVGAACVEEMLMRGLLYSGLSQVVGRLAGTLLSSLVFGVIHGNLLQGLYAFLLGVMFCFVYDLSGRDLKAPVLAHMSANFASVLTTMVPGISRMRVFGFEIQTAVFTVLLAGSLFGIYICQVKKDKDKL